MDLSSPIPLAVVGLVLIVGGVVATRVFLPRLILWWELRGYSPEARIEFDKKAELLENDAVVELLAPASRFQSEVAEGKKPHHQQAWLSPFPNAVRAANKRRRFELKRRKSVTLTRAQVAAAAAAIAVEQIPEALQPANAGPEHFWITVQLKGLTEQKIVGLMPELKAELGLESITRVASADTRSVRFEAHTVTPDDRLTGEKHGRDFFESNPATNLASIPLAVTVDGSVWKYPMHHGLVLGMTGSGKGSPLQGIIRQVAPGVVEGRVRLFGIDPKDPGEFKSFQHSSLFEELVVGQDEEELDQAVALIERVFTVMKTRGRNLKIDLEGGDLGRSLDYTTETPLVLLMIDEFLSLLQALQAMGKVGKHALFMLTLLLAQGRSLGVIVIAATQEADKELLGRMRNNFANVIVLKQPSPYFNDLFLGEGAAAAGFDSTKIAPASKANGYATAGIGFVKEETGEPVRVRFAYSDDRDIADLVLAHPRKAVTAFDDRSDEPGQDGEDDFFFVELDEPELPEVGDAFSALPDFDFDHEEMK